MTGVGHRDNSISNFFALESETVDPNPSDIIDAVLHGVDVQWHVIFRSCRSSFITCTHRGYLRVVDM
jgi:hypothetical protein